MIEFAVCGDGRGLTKRGRACRLPAQTLREEFHRNATIRLLLLRYTQALITQMTHELIANMLGVRREGVTAAVSKLQRLGVINHSRGHITVLDRPASSTA